MIQSNKNKEVALDFAEQYLMQCCPKVCRDNLYVLFCREEPGFWRCYVSSDELDNYGEHLLIEYHVLDNEASIQYCVPDDDMAQFIWGDGTMT